MKRVRQANTSAEGALRRALRALGLRYRVQVPVIAKPRRVADVAFVGPRVAVFVDGRRSQDPHQTLRPDSQVFVLQALSGG